MNNQNSSLSSTKRLFNGLGMRKNLNQKQAKNKTNEYDRFYISIILTTQDGIL
jgi:hypothetical protein